MEEIKNKIFIISTMIIICFFALHNYIDPDTISNQDLYTGSSFPFLIEVSPPIIYITRSTVMQGDELVERAGEDRCFKMNISILNTTDQDFKNAWYEMELNPEAEPFIASGIIKYSSSDRFYVTTAEKARGDVIGGLPKVTGFDHEWDTLLTTSEDLMEFYNQGSDGIYNALQSITVRVYWDGGSQEEIIPLQLNK